MPKSKTAILPSPLMVSQGCIFIRRGSWLALTITAPVQVGARELPVLHLVRSSAPPCPIRARELDQFYTRDDLAELFFGVFKQHFDPALFQFLEPSAGGGAFLRILPDGSFGCDIEPMSDDILGVDFLTLEVRSSRDIVAIGNPPYGKNSKLAVAFFNHAAKHAQVIAFVLPKTFRKVSTVNKLNDEFHLVREVDVPANAFLFQGRPRDVPAVFQIWERRDYRRLKTPAVRKHADFEFTTWDKADFAMQRVGADAGRVHHEMHKSEKAHYFIKGDVEDVMRSLAPAFAAVAANTAGKPSLAMTEIVEIYDAWKAKARRSHRRR